MKTVVQKSKLISDEEIYLELSKSDEEGKIIASDEELIFFENWLEE